MRKPLPPRAKTSSSSANRNFTLGRGRFAKISAIEGIALTPAMEALFDRFERDGLGPSERRRAIIGRFAPIRRNG